MAGTKWEVGQVVVLMSGYPDRAIVPVRIRKVWKNGVAEIESLDRSEGYKGRTFDEHGGERGGHGWHIPHIRPLEDGETAESILAAQKDAAEKQRRERNTAERENQTAIDTWWKAEGMSLWASAPQLATGLDLPDRATVRLVCWAEQGEKRASIVIIRNHINKLTNKEAVILRSSGIASRKYKEDDEVSLSSFTTGSIEAPTIMEALYRLTH